MNPECGYTKITILIKEMFVAVVVLSVAIAIIVFGNDAPKSVGHPPMSTFILCNFYPTESNDVIMTFANRVSVEILNDTQMEEYRLNQLKTCHTFWNVEFQNYYESGGYYEAEGAEQTEGDYEAGGAAEQTEGTEQTEIGSEWSESDWEKEGEEYQEEESGWDQTEGESQTEGAEQTEGEEVESDTQTATM